MSTLAVYAGRRGSCPYFFNRIRTHPGLNLRTAVRRARGKIKLAANRSGWVLGPFGTRYRFPTRTRKCVAQLMGRGGGEPAFRSLQFRAPAPESPLLGGGVSLIGCGR